MTAAALGNLVFFAAWLAAALLAAGAIVYCWRRFGPAD